MIDQGRALPGGWIREGWGAVNLETIRQQLADTTRAPAGPRSHCSYCHGSGQPGPACTCKEPCDRGCCPKLMERQRAAGIEWVLYSAEYDPQRVPLMAKEKRVTGDDWCRNCLEAPAVTSRGGYACCDECAAQADLPAYLRGRQ